MDRAGAEEPLAGPDDAVGVLGAGTGSQGGGVTMFTVVMHRMRHAGYTCAGCCRCHNHRYRSKQSCAYFNRSPFHALYPGYKLSASKANFPPATCTVRRRARYHYLLYGFLIYVSAYVTAEIIRYRSLSSTN